MHDHIAAELLHSLNVSEQIASPVVRRDTGERMPL